VASGRCSRSHAVARCTLAEVTTEADPGAEAPVAAPRRGRPWRVAVVVGLAAALTAGGIVLLTRPRGPDVALALGFEEGTTYRYRMTMSFDGTVDSALAELPMTGEIEQTIAYDVVEVADDGAATIDVRIEDASGVLSGQPVPPTGDQEVRMVVEADGSLREVDGEPVPDALQGGFADPSGTGGLPGMQSFPLLPDEPVGPGDEWVKDLEQPLPFGQGAIRVHSENEFVDYEDVDGTRTAVIDSAVTSPIDWTIDLAELAELGDRLDQGSGIADVEGLPTSISYLGEVVQDQTTWLDVERGEIVRSELAGEFDITTRAEGGQGLGALAAAVPVRMAGEMGLTMERLAS
jgi:hypothetical protein